MKDLILKYIVVLAGLGVIIFFPVRLNNDFTCLYHRYFGCTEHPVRYQNGNPKLSSGEQQYDSFKNEKQTNISEPSLRGDLVQHYIRHFALFWWLSIGIFTLSIFRLMKRKSNLQKDKKV